jgi:hypothetical protein
MNGMCSQGIRAASKARPQVQDGDRSQVLDLQKVESLAQETGLRGCLNSRRKLSPE